MARGWHYAKISLSSALLPFSGLCVVLYCSFHFVVFVLFLCSRWSFVDVPLIFSCPADHVLDWQPRIYIRLRHDRLIM